MWIKHAFEFLHVLTNDIVGSRVIFPLLWPKNFGNWCAGNIPELIMKQFMYTVEDDKRFLITKYRTQAGFIQFKTETRTYSLRVIPYPLIVENELKTLIASRIEVPTNSFLMELSEVPN